MTLVGIQYLALGRLAGSAPPAQMVGSFLVSGQEYIQVAGKCSNYCKFIKNHTDE
jgi:hypothetical protein